jgi:hypothetical protein
VHVLEHGGLVLQRATEAEAKLKRLYQAASPT